MLCLYTQHQCEHSNLLTHLLSHSLLMHAIPENSISDSWETLLMIKIDFQTKKNWGGAQHTFEEHIIEQIYILSSWPES